MSDRKLCVGVVAFNKPERLDECIAAIRGHSVTAWRLLIVNNSPDNETVNQVIKKHVVEDAARITFKDMPQNVGYAGGVNQLLGQFDTEYLAFLDDDALIQTPGWDEIMCGYLDRFHEIGMVFPNGGPYPIERAGYTEILWGVGYAWCVNRAAVRAVGKLNIGMYGYTVDKTLIVKQIPDSRYGEPFGAFDESIGHQQDPDFCMRVRLAGYKCAAAPEVVVHHAAVSTNDPASTERVAAGVRDFVDKWERYHGGARQSYFSENVLRFDLYPINALYLEEWFKRRPELVGLNATPDVVIIDGREYDLINVPRVRVHPPLPGAAGSYYRGRVI